MKSIFLIFLISFLSTGCSADVVPQEPAKVVEPQVQPTVEKKKKCIMVFDAKQNKEIEKCKVLSIHQKHDGTVVPKK